MNRTFALFFQIFNSKLKLVNENIEYVGIKYNSGQLADRNFLFCLTKN